MSWEPWLRILVLIAFLLFTVGGGSTIGIITAPGEWYASLAKPWFNPPDWVFGPVWAVLYVLVAMAGWRVWRARARHPQRLWWLQIVLNFLWPLVFFGLEAPGPALAVILVLLLAILAFIGTSRQADRTAALLFVPYGLWVAYASLLNAAIWWLN